MGWRQKLAEGRRARSRQSAAHGRLFFFSQKPGSAESPGISCKYIGNLQPWTYEVPDIMCKSQPYGTMDIVTTTQRIDFCKVASPYPRDCARCGSRNPRSVELCPPVPWPVGSLPMLDRSCSRASTMLPLKLMGPAALTFPGSP